MFRHDFGMIKKSSKKSLLDAYQFPGFRTSKVVKGLFGDKNALVLTLSRRSKKVSVLNAQEFIEAGTTARPDWFAIFRVAIVAYTLRLRPVDCSVR